VNAPRGASERLKLFVDLLLHWNRSVNLISRADEALVWERHVADAQQLVRLIPKDIERAVDLGSGGGFPGLVLAIETGIRFDLIEADHRKAAFLREAARRVSAPVSVHVSRIETARVAPAPLVTARALAPLPRLLELSVRFLAPGGLCIFPKGTNANIELTTSSTEWHMRVEQVPSLTAQGAVILCLSGITRANAEP
jgi:16S rRNA (guanine527-N7)-methyltransferase